MKWFVYKAGYQWDGDFIRPIDSTIREYEVGEALFRKFIETPPTKAGILKFANQYGSLYNPHDKEKEHADGGFLNCITPNKEALTPWRYYILNMRAAVEVWDAVMNKKPRELRSHIAYTYRPTRGETHIKYQWRKDRPDGGFNACIPGSLRYGEIERPAKAWVFSVINGMLEPPDHNIHAKPVTEAHFARGTEVHLSMVWDHENNNPPEIVPKSQSLIGELWLQFARVVTTGYQPRACQECGNWFISGPKRGPKQVFCSGACRVRAHRRKSK